MTGPSPHSVILCCRESGRPRDEQADVPVRFMAANLSLVWIRSCSALYHVDFISSETGLACRFLHIWFQAVRGNFLTIHISVGGLPFIANICRTIYRVSQEERAKLREGVPYVKLYRYNPKHLYPKLNGYGDYGQRSLKL